MSEQSDQQNRLSKHNNSGIQRTRSEDLLPPELPTWKKVLLGIAWIVVLSGIIGAAYLCTVLILKPEFPLPCLSCWPYIAGGALLIGLILDRYLRHKSLIHRARLKDSSEVRAFIVEANSVAKLREDESTVANFKQKKQCLKDEVSRLEDLGPSRWVEYQVLPISQKLVDFLSVADLRAQAQLSLSELEDYAQDTAYRYDIEGYVRWETRINEAIEKTESLEKTDNGKQDNQDENAEQQLRAELKYLLEHIAGYYADWARGSTVMRSLMICGITALIILIVLGLLPVLYQAGGQLGILHWGLLGASGSLAAALRYVYKSNRVEIGNTEGTGELLRTILGLALGFVAGIIIYAIIGGGLLHYGGAVPDLHYENPFRDSLLSILWAFSGGYYFEGVFDRIPGLTERKA